MFSREHRLVETVEIVSDQNNGGVHRVRTVHVVHPTPKVTRDTRKPRFVDEIRVRDVIDFERAVGLARIHERMEGRMCPYWLKRIGSDFVCV
jgi:hypothetical protein